MKKNKRIQPAKFFDAEIIAFIVSQGNKDVAEKFELTLENNPKHPSFYTKEWILSDIDRGEEYFLYRINGVNCGCVAFEQANSDISYLNRLSVLPEYRHKGIGEQLVKHVLEYSRTKNIQMVSIGIIAEHTLLKKWYLELGFIKGETKHFDHLPFDVIYMSYEL
ncbi:MAG: GNAT family N-acetyltransferase [Desulfobacula sp.]|jgi:ribosomal protein S18 acetylase RimI-like enzyme|uniref:GNAT family N-acetyltransferase n=1 Tax=Desulfobacula sp. TaxID=2593537 RepID=UPI001E0AF19A|nr:GNAT family N-acetyltransferase [Desulfobacula sp.]MBT3804465.1 GNAT family N-acetyltransferase [Desulfobacula sp.]MBT4024941.1 GNAT family N-acetyltransferase [Desulfobacula sp.]MBT4198827.1 GNAT family N-acetyltransferase [Desulfobacula sp.]MBT4508043.1 GNAT family N-acetyltransferase [Desulfobacula sp.]